MTKEEVFKKLNGTKLYTGGRTVELCNKLISLGFKRSLSVEPAYAFIYLNDGVVGVDSNMEHFSGSKLKEITPDDVWRTNINRFLAGDFVYCKTNNGQEYVWILRSDRKTEVSYYALLHIGSNTLNIHQSCSNAGEKRMATDSEIKMLINALEEDGMRWDEENEMIVKIEKEEVKFQPYEKVLVRDSDSNVWIANFYSHYDSENDLWPHVTVSESYNQCIPYLGNEKLLGTTDSPDELLNLEFDPE